MKYYTLDKIMMESKQGGADICIEYNFKFTTGLYNLTRGLFGYKPKRYYLKESKE